MTDTSENVNQFFQRYATALLDRDARAVADMYAVPSLIVFPGNVIPVSDAKQTEEFFASSWDQYEGVETVDKRIAIMAEAPGSVWVDVTWSYHGRPKSASATSSSKSALITRSECSPLWRERYRWLGVSRRR